MRETLDWHWPEFEIPDEIYRGWDARQRGAEVEAAWNEKFSIYRKRYPDDAAEFRRRVRGDLPENWQETSRTYIEATRQKAEKIASRKASQNALNAYGPTLPELIGGSADLTGSNLTLRQDSTVISDTVADGNYLYYGVREFAMAAINNGLALHGGFIPYGGTFLIFTEYARNALRMAALMKQRNIFVLTHDFNRPWGRRPNPPVGGTGRDPAPGPEHVGVAPV